MGGPTKAELLERNAELKKELEALKAEKEGAREASDDDVVLIQDQAQVEQLQATVQQLEEKLEALQGQVGELTTKLEEVEGRTSPEAIQAMVDKAIAGLNSAAADHTHPDFAASDHTHDPVLPDYATASWFDQLNALIRAHPPGLSGLFHWLFWWRH